MAPFVPRLHLFEIDDQPWFPSYFRSLVQDGLWHVWTFHLPVLESCSPAILVSRVLQRVLGHYVSDYAYIDFCAGAGGPTPVIEQALNTALLNTPAKTNGKSYAQVTAAPPPSVDFVLTDLHPHPAAWERASRRSAHIAYEPEPVDASNAPMDLINKYRQGGKKVFRMFNLAFHHFDDGLARAILKDTVSNSDAFGIDLARFSIFELQDRSVSSFLSVFALGLLVPIIAPLLYWWSPLRLFWVYIIPIVPFVLVFDGLVSCLRTRTSEEVEVLLRTCGADSEDWVIESGQEQFLWPTGYLTWIVCTKKGRHN